MACPGCVVAGGVFFWPGVVVGATAVFAYATNPAKRRQVIAAVAAVALVCVAYLFKSWKVQMELLAKTLPNKVLVICALAVLGIVAVRAGYRSVTP
jgi:hypothetical protein